MKRIWFLIPATAWLVIISLASLISARNFSGIEVNITNLDKLIHATIYAVLCILLAWGFMKYWNVKFLKIKTLVIIFCSSALFGFLMEVLQKEITSSRHFDINDIIANIIGAFIGSSIFIIRK